MNKKLKQYSSILPLFFLYGCASWFNHPQKDQLSPITTTSSQRQEESVPVSPAIPGKSASSSTRSASTYANNTPKRIEEDRNAGEVELIKVNNRNLPAYYIYPTQQQNYNTNRTPDQNISPPNWQISW